MPKMTVVLRKLKSRGPVLEEAICQYDYGETVLYSDMIDSFELVTDDKLDSLKQSIEKRRLVSKYEEAIEFILPLLSKKKSLIQSEIMTQWEKTDPKNRASRRKTLSALAALTDVLWTADKGENNSTIYSLIGLEESNTGGDDAGKTGKTKSLFFD